MDAAHIAVVVPDVLAVAACAAGAATDLRTYRIPNCLTVSAMVAGVVANTAIATALGGIGNGLSAGLVPALLGGAVCLVLFGALGIAGAIGMGDVKLMIGAGALMRWPLALWAMIYVLVAGGGVALAFALARGNLGTAVGNLKRLAGRDRAEVRLQRIPYGLALFLGCLYAVLGRYYPVLRLP